MASAPLMVSISGIRGVSGVSLTPPVILKYVAAFALHQQSAGCKIVLGRDSRLSGPWIEQFVSGLLVACGCQVISLGIVPTPTVQLLVQKEGAKGGIVITSSHNPIEWNGLKFVNQDGLFSSPLDCEEIFRIADGGKFQFQAYNALGSLLVNRTATQSHIEAVLSLPYIDPLLIRDCGFKVALDTVNGAGGPILKTLLERCGCEVIGLNLEPTGYFAHSPEPVPENLTDLCQLVQESGADLGIGIDPDADRCVLIDEHGNPIGEEYTLALAVEFFLKHCNRRGAVCKNLSTTRAIDDIAAKHGCPVYAAPVGEINVALKMVETNAIIGGEGNGGIMLPDVHIGRDSVVAVALTLQHLAIAKTTLSILKKNLPQYEIVKLKAPLSGLDPDAAIDQIKQKYQSLSNVSLNSSDGLRIDTPEWWVHLRKSNTEPIIRVIGEGQTYEKGVEICQMFLKEIQATKL